MRAKDVTYVIESIYRGCGVVIRTLQIDCDVCIRIMLCSNTVMVDICGNMGLCATIRHEWFVESATAEALQHRENLLAVEKSLKKFMNERVGIDQETLKVENALEDEAFIL